LSYKACSTDVRLHQYHRWPLARPQTERIWPVVLLHRGRGDRRKARLEDIAVLTGGQLITEDAGLKLDTTKLEQLGKARRVTVTIAENAGINGAVVAEHIKSLPFTQGYDAAKGEYTGLLKAGIVDPAKVTRSALQNAGSIAGMVLTTECIVADMPEPKHKAPAGAGGGMGGDFDY
jgi:chaperonin GroEL (HSP60 family)